MSNLSNKLSTIANAIRAKASTNNLMLVDDFAPNILNIPTGIEPTGTETITNNGTYNIYNKAEAVVNVPVGVFPAGSQTFNTNGTYNVYNIAEAVVNVAGIEPSGSQEFNTNGTYNVYNIAQAIVNVAGVEPNGSQEFNFNGTYNVYNIAEAIVNVPQNIDMNNYTYLVNSVSQRDQLSANKDDICILYRTTGGSPSIGDTFGGGIIVDSITVPKFEDDWSSLEIRTVDGDGWGQCSMDTYQMSFNLDLWSESGSYRIDMNYQAEEVGDNFVYTFSSGNIEYYNDGEYVRTELNVGDNYELPSPIVFENGDGSHYEYLLQMFNSFVVDEFEAYSYNGNNWEFLDIGTTATYGLIYDGATAYTSNGHIMGSFGTLSTPDQVSLLENILVAAANASNANLYQSFKEYPGPDAPMVLDLINTTGCENFSECFYNSGITSIPDIDTTSAKDYSNMFWSCTNITDITNIQNYKLENIDNAYGMFYSAGNRICNINNLTISGAENVGYMFSTSEISESVYPANSVVSNITVRNVGSANSMFTFNAHNKTFRDITIDNASSVFGIFASVMYNINSLTLENISFKNTTNISGLFAYVSPYNLNITNLDISDAVYAQNLFYKVSISGNIQLPYIDFANTNIIDISNAFAGKNGPITYSNDLDIIPKINQMSYNFSKIENFGNFLYQVRSKRSDYYSFLNTIDFSSAKDISGLFAWTTGLMPNINDYNINIQNITSCGSLYNQVNAPNSVTGTFNIDFPNSKDLSCVAGWSNFRGLDLVVNGSNIEDASRMVSHTNAKSVSVNLSNCNNCSWALGDSNISVGVSANLENIKNCNTMFYGLKTPSLVVNINLAGTESATSFVGQSKITNLVVNLGSSSAPYTSNITDVIAMFDYSNIKSLNYLPDMPYVTNIYAMFASCSKLQTLNCTFNMPNVDKIEAMFSGCNSLVLSNPDMFNFGTITNAYAAFCNGVRIANTNVINALTFAPNADKASMFWNAIFNEPLTSEFINAMINNSSNCFMLFANVGGTVYLPEVLNFSENVRNISGFIQNYGGTTHNITRLNIQAPNATDSSYSFRAIPTLRVVENVYLPNAVSPYSMFENCDNIEEFGNITVLNNMGGFFTRTNLNKIHTIGNVTFATEVVSHYINIANLYGGKPNLVNVGSLIAPTRVYTDITIAPARNLCSGSGSLSAASVDNIIGGLANFIVTNVSSANRTLTFLGMNQYASIIPTLSNYNNFINAGWTL